VVVLVVVGVIVVDVEATVVVEAQPPGVHASQQLGHCAG
jgi:hypothetical protein